MLLLLDSASIWYRAYYGMPESLVSPKGEPVNAIRGYLDMVSRLINQYQPTGIVAAIEGDWRPSWRIELFPGYKANRLDEEGEEEEPDLLTPQIPILLEVLEDFGIPVIGADDYEADDVIATLSKSSSLPVRVATGDRDLFQLVDRDRDVKVIYLAKGISNHDLVDENWIEQKYGIPGSRYALFAMIRGDSSDGLPGVRGIGEKGAAELARNFENLSELILAFESNSEKLPEKYKKKISESRSYVDVMEKLVMCATDVPVPKIPPKFDKNKIKTDRIYTHKADYGLGTSIEKMLTALNKL